MESLLISACLLGIACRYDGKSKPKLTDEEILKLKEKYRLIPVCPEIYGGLPTPREGSERVGERVIMKDGRDVTENYKRGAEAALRLAQIFACERALLKERSPSCGFGLIHDGTFTGTLTEGMGVSAELLSQHGVEVLGESRLNELF